MFRRRLSFPDVHEKRFFEFLGSLLKQSIILADAFLDLADIISIAVFAVCPWKWFHPPPSLH